MIFQGASLLLEGTKLYTEARFLIQIEQRVKQTKDALNNANFFLPVSLKKDPPVGNQLYSPNSLSAEFNTLGTGGEVGLATAILPDPLFTVPVGGGLLPTVFRLGTGVLSQIQVEVPPGSSNFRKIMFSLTPAVGRIPGAVPFTLKCRGDEERLCEWYAERGLARRERATGSPQCPTGSDLLDYGLEHRDSRRHF